ncbi:kinase phosphorylation protein-domain-containing protein [Xylaria palmicola]|nr:kinase phosphorylation protein-domain-containing protein [Xylaria palmicola]
MDLVSSIRKTGSRGGVNFNWEDVSTSTHRENYLGHSLKAPVGRWQKGRDLSWYAKANDVDAPANETTEEKAARERKEELKKIKEAEEDALARALGLPVAPRNVTGANAVDVAQSRVPSQNDNAPDVEGSKPDHNDSREPRRHGDSERRHKRRHRSRSRSRDPDRRGHHHRRHRHHHDDQDRDRRRDRSPRERHGTRHARPRDERDDKHSYHRRRSHSHERETQVSGNSHRRDRDRSRSAGGLEGRRVRRDSHGSLSRDGWRNESPQRYRRRSPGRG